MKMQREELLRPGESIVWESTPEPFSMLSKAARSEVLFKWIVFPLFCLFVAVLKVTHSDHSEVGFVVFAVLLAAVLFCSSLLKKRQVMRQQYFMTGERVFLLKSGNAYYMELKHIDGIRVVTDQTPQPTVVFGKAIFPDIRSHLLWRAAAEVPTKDHYGMVEECTAMVFFNIKNAAALVSKLSAAGVKQV